VITRVEIDLTPDQIAEFFISMESYEQSRFLNMIGKHFKDAHFDAEYQCLWLAKEIDKDGRDFIYTVANFLKARGISFGAPKEKALLNSYPCDGLY